MRYQSAEVCDTEGMMNWMHDNNVSVLLLLTTTHATFLISREHITGAWQEPVEEHGLHYIYERLPR